MASTKSQPFQSRSPFGFLHSGEIMRPGNVMVAPDGQVEVIDSGLCKGAKNRL